jgi:hypothetical protein
MKFIVINLLFLALAECPSLWADSVSAARDQAYISQNGTFLLLVQQTESGGKWKMSFFERRNGAPSGENPDRFELLWKKPYSGVAPNSFFLANDGQWIVQTNVMLENGKEPLEAVRIYDSQGEPTRTISIKELFAPGDIETIPNTTSMLLWGGKHGYAPNGRFILKLWKSGDPVSRNMRFRDCIINLREGSLEK